MPEIVVNGTRPRAWWPVCDGRSHQQRHDRQPAG